MKNKNVLGMAEKLTNADATTNWKAYNRFQDSILIRFTNEELFKPVHQTHVVQNAILLLCVKRNDFHLTFDSEPAELRCISVRRTAC